MAVAPVKFFLQRLESLLLQESLTFTGIEDQMERITSSLREIGELLGERGSIEGGDALSSWMKELDALICDMDDQADEFIIQLDQGNGSDSLGLKDEFRNILQKSESRLTDTVHRLFELHNSTSTETEKGKNVDDYDVMEEDPAGTGKSSTKTEKGKNVEDYDVMEEDPLGTRESTDIEILEGDEEESNQESDEENGKTPSASSYVVFKSKYSSLPYYLQSCLIYCAIFPENHWIHKGKLVRMLVAEGLVQEKAVELLEDVAEENINELIRQGMLEVMDENPGDRVKFTVSSPYRKLVKEHFISTHVNSDSSLPHTTRRVLTSDLTKIAHSLNSLRPRSLFLHGKQHLPEGNWLNFAGAKFLRVLDLEDAGIKSLPEEVGDLIHLTYLGLKHNDIQELPARVGNLRALQTLDMRMCGYLTALPSELLNLARLRHLKMLKNMGVRGMKLPEGIGRFKNLLTLTGVQAGNGISRKLGILTQLRRLGVMDVDEENANELYSSIMNMQGLISLSLEPKQPSNKGNLVLLESFLPPLLVKLRLEGQLEKIPNWLGSITSLTKLRLGFSNLSESPTLVLQKLPNLKVLTLWRAYEAKTYDREFCKAGGFPKLEVLIISSHSLEEWAELDEGALPRLQYLHFHNCSHLRKLPEGLQFITSLKQLYLLPLLDEHAERLKPDGGEENYKISNIPTIRFLPMSALSSIFRNSPMTSKT